MQTNQIDVIQRLLDYLVQPLPFLLGVVAAFSACCLSGRHDSKRNPFESFQRFHPQIAPDTQFYPTASQVRALGASRLRKDKVAVIIGGNSVTYGVGHSVERLWSKKLQELLGDEYVVVNLAMRGANHVEFGSPAAEMLVRDFPKLIFVPKIDPHLISAVEPDGWNTYRYLFWDALSKGLIDASQERRASMERFAVQLDEKKREQLTELRLRSRFNALLYFQDFWNTVAYEHFATVWHPLLTPGFGRPLRSYCDVSYEATTLEQRYPPATLENEDRIVHGRIESRTALDPLAESDASGDPNSILDPELRKHVEEFHDCMPSRLHDKTLFLLVRDSPYIVRRMTPEDQAAYAKKFHDGVTVLEKLGYRALDVGEDFDDFDFNDRCHLASGGGDKMAAKLAPAIVKLAEERGFLKR